ncbi:MAG: hypothetical protein WC702_00770 [Patescibacteria group bacterium]
MAKLQEYYNLRPRLSPFSDGHLLGLMVTFCQAVTCDPDKFHRLPRTTVLGPKSEAALEALSAYIQKQTVAHISGTLGCGVVYDGDKVFLIKADEKEPREAGTTNLGMWMQGPSDIEAVVAGEYPYAEAFASLQEATDKARALAHLLSRRETNKGRAQKDNSGRRVGSPMYFYCESCGQEIVVPEEHFNSPRPRLCRKCKIMKNRGWLE